MPDNVNTSITQVHLPVDMANPNEFVSYSNSFILMPMLGPVAINKRIKTAAIAIAYLEKFINLIEKSIEVSGNTNRAISMHSDLGIRLTPENLAAVNSNRNLASRSASVTTFEIFQPVLAAATSAVAPPGNVIVGEQAQVLLKMLSEGNPVFDMAFNAEQVVKKGVLVSKQNVEGFIKAKTNKLKMLYVLEKMIKPSNPNAKWLNNNLPLLKKGAEFAKLLGSNTAGVILGAGNTQAEKKNRSLLAGFLQESLIKSFEIYDGKDLADADAEEEEAEWALIRRDMIKVTFKDKLLRGPIETVSVSPNASNEVVDSYESVITSQSVNENISASSSFTQRSQSIADSIATSTMNSVESGTRTQNSFNNTAVVRNSMNERMSSATRQQLHIISQMNRQASLSSLEESVSKKTTYKTSGVDDQLSNTEVLFEAFAKTTVQATVNDINLVWCPRIHAPYMHMKRTINRAANQARLDYERINYVVDAAEPPLHYEHQSQSKEVAAKGDDRENFYNVVIPVPGNLQSGEWELDYDHVDTSFRNGVSDDYDWTERGNWDDLENWTTDVVSIDRVGNEVTVRVILETTDPEYWNKGFVKATIHFKKLTAESRADLKNYEQQLERSRLEREAIKVRARQLANLKKQELTDKLQRSPEELKKIVIYNLLRAISIPNKRKNISLYFEALKSCLDWNGIHIENEIETQPPYPLYPYDHIVNTLRARVFLPIRKEKESDFVRLVREFATNVYTNKIDSIVSLVGQRRNDIKNAANPPKLFEYDDEIVLGMHRENVFSNTNFKFV